jgi:lipid-binding SYLF domain-containing protein
MAAAANKAVILGESGNVTAGLTIVGHSAQRQAPIGKCDIETWSDQSGVFVGANIDGTDVTQNLAQDRAYYGRPVTAAQILGGRLHNAQASRLRAALPT